MRTFQAFATAAAILGAPPGFASGQTVGKPAPDFQATILDGGKVSLADFKARFWS